jgi:hypothetical protein
MRAALLALAVLGGCRCESDPPPDRTKEEGAPAMPWYGVAVGGLKLQLPRSFQPSPQHSVGNSVLFLDDEKGGYRATVLVYWNVWEGTIEAWAEHNRLKYDYPESPTKVLERGWTTVGGRRAFYMVYELQAKVPKLGNREKPFLLIDWYVAHDGHAGYIRGIALQDRFAFEYRPIFEQIAARATYAR